MRTIATISVSLLVGVLAGAQWPAVRGHLSLSGPNQQSDFPILSSAVYGNDASISPYLVDGVGIVVIEPSRGERTIYVSYQEHAFAMSPGEVTYSSLSNLEQSFTVRSNGDTAVLQYVTLNSRGAVDGMALDYGVDGNLDLRGIASEQRQEVWLGGQWVSVVETGRDSEGRLEYKALVDGQWQKVSWGVFTAPSISPAPGNANKRSQPMPLRGPAAG